MKLLARITPIGVLLFLLLLLPVKSSSQIEIDTSNMGPPEEDPTIEELKDTLSNSGNWVDITEDEIDPGVVEDEESNVIDDDVNTNFIWIPNPIFIYVGWNPYIDGRWVWTCWGWQWVPYENWGWCTYHYGRWWHHHRYGWVWSPGRRWRHCWVTWYRTGNYWGWHPLPPRIHYRGGIAVIPKTTDVENDGWVFVNKKDFTKTVDKTTIIDARKHTEIFSGANENVEVKKKKDDGTTLGPNTNVPKTKGTDPKGTNPKTEKNTNDYGTNDQGKKVEKKKEKTDNNNTDYNSGNKKQNDSWYTPPKTETKYDPPKTEQKQSPPKNENSYSPPPKQETKQSPPPKEEQKQSPPPQKNNDSSPPPQKKDNSSGN